MRLRASFLCSIAALTIAASASAQSWAGFYVGANAGYSAGSSDVQTETVFSPTGYFATSSVPAIATAGMGTVSPSGFTGGVGAGFNMESGNLVYGIEGDYSYVSAKDSRTDGAIYPCCNPTSFSITQTVSEDYLATLRLRIGFKNKEWLFFATAGAAWTKAKMTEEFSDDFATAAQSGEESKNITGAVIGLGAERKIGKSDQWSVKLEYMYNKFGTQTFTGGTLTAFTGPVIPFPTNVFTNSFDLSTNVLRAGLNYRFK